MNKESFIPRLRFQDFQSSYFMDKVKHIGSFSKGRGYTKKDLKNNGHPIIMYGQLYTDYNFTIKNVKRYVDLINGSVISKGNEVIIPASGETSEDIARASSVNIPGVILGGDLNVITPSEKIHPPYLAMNLSSRNSKKQMMNKAQGKSIVHLQNDDIKKVIIHYPSKDEQVKVSDLISKIEKNIELRNIDLKKLKNFKQSMIQKMFPKEGEMVPEIRFEGFGGEWNEKELDDITNITGGYAFKSTDFKNNGSPVVRITNINSNGTLIGPYMHVDSALSISNEFMLKEKEILVALSGATTGKAALNTNFNGYVNQRIGVIRNNEYSDIRFIYAKLSSQSFQSFINNNVGAGAQPNISTNTIKKYTFFVPNLEEQILIGNYFKNLDKNIKAKQAELDKLKQFKQAMLDKMFV